MKIAVIGKIRSGKDTFAKAFVNGGLQEYKFGTGIAEIIQKYFPKEWEKGKPRHLYQGIGQGFRKFDEDVWVNYLAKQIAGLDNIIITDVRQVNEVKWLKEQGFTIIKIVSSPEKRIQRMVKEGDTWNVDNVDHETETQVDLVPKEDIDWVVHNNGTLQEFIFDSETILGIMQQREHWNAIMEDGGMTNGKA